MLRTWSSDLVLACALMLPGCLAVPEFAPCEGECSQADASAAGSGDAGECCDGGATALDAEPPGQDAAPPADAPAIWWTGYFALNWTDDLAGACGPPSVTSDRLLVSETTVAYQDNLSAVMAPISVTSAVTISVAAGIVLSNAVGDQTETLEAHTLTLAGGAYSGRVDTVRRQLPSGTVICAGLYDIYTVRL